MSHPQGAYLPSIKERGPTVDAERLRQSVADWSAALAAVSDLPSAVRQDVVDALELAQRFNAEVVRPLALPTDLLTQDNPQHVPQDLVRLAGEWGLFTLWLPSLFGGKGWNFLSLYAFLEEVSSACVGVANIVGVHYMGVAALTATWNLRLADRVFSEVCAGERRGEPCLLSVAFNEPKAGSDVAETMLLDRARLVSLAQGQPDGSYQLDGHKTWISNGQVATWHMVMACEDPGRPADTMVLLAVRADTPGLRLGALHDKLGQKACVASELVFEHCQIPADQVALSQALTRALGRPHREVVQTLLDYIESCTRAGVGAFAAGTARGALDAARDGATRKMLPAGRMIDQQWAQSILAEMSKNASLARQAYLESALANGMGGLFRMMFFRPLYWADQLAPMSLWRTAARWILRSPQAAQWFQHRFLAAQPGEWQRLISGLASMAKFAGSDLAMCNVGLALELAGPEGLRHDAGLEKRLRDAKVLQIYEGTDQLNRVNLFKCRVSPDEGVRLFVQDAPSATGPVGMSADVGARWPADAGLSCWQAADAFAQAHLGPAHGGAGRGSEALSAWLEAMQGMGWSTGLGEPAPTGSGLAATALCQVLEALAAHNASAAVAVYASAAAHEVLRASRGQWGRRSAGHMVGNDWMAWPAFHDINEQLWPLVDGQGHLRGQVDMMVLGTHAHWAVLPAQVQERGLCMVLVDLSHPAVIRGAAIRTLGLPACGINDVEFGGVPCEVLSDQGLALFHQLSAGMAPAVMALQAGLSRASFQAAAQYAATRLQGGGVLMGWGEVRRLLSLMQERLHVVQGLLQAALAGAEATGTRGQYASLHACRLACLLTQDGVQLLGAEGYHSHSPQAQRMRDARQVGGLLGGVAWRRQSLFEQQGQVI